MKLKHKLFRKAVKVADRIDCWFKDLFGTSPKQKALEVAQESLTLKKLDDTIGVSLGIKRVDQ